MSQQAMASYLSLGGNEIVNAARLKAYVDAGLAPSGFNILCSGCEGLEDILQCINEDAPPGGYQLPELPALPADPEGHWRAPWYDPNVPESKNFAGLLVTSVTVSSPYSREVTNGIGNGGTLGRLRINPRTIVVHGFLIGKTCCATQYGLQWLTSVLTGSGCENCGGDDLDFLTCCPSINGEDACITVTDPETGRGTIYVRPNEESEYERADDFWRTMHNVGLVSGPDVISCKGNSCGCGCGALIEVEFTLAAASPYMNSLEKEILHVVPTLVGCKDNPDDEETVTIDPTDPATEDCADDHITIVETVENEVCPDDGDTLEVEWLECPESNDLCNITWIPVGDGELCASASDCPPLPSCIEDPFCPAPPVPPVPSMIVAPDCACIPLRSTRVFATVTPTRVWGSSTINFEVYAGDKDMRNLAIRIWQNPLGKDCSVTGCEGEPTQPTEHQIGCGAFRGSYGVIPAPGSWCDGNDDISTSLTPGEWAGYKLDPFSPAGTPIGARVLAHLSTIPDPRFPGQPESMSVEVGVADDFGTFIPDLTEVLVVPNDGLVREFTALLPFSDEDWAALRDGGRRLVARVLPNDDTDSDAYVTAEVHELTLTVRAMPKHCIPEFPDCAACATLIVSYIPANGVLRFSGEERTVTITCGPDTVNALRSIASTGNGPFDWPDLECSPVCVAVDFDCASTAENASVTISQVYRDL